MARALPSTSVEAITSQLGITSSLLSDMHPRARRLDHLLPPVLCHVFSQRLTEMFWPVMMKAVLRSSEAVGLKGGVLRKIAKPSAVSNTTAGYRGIHVKSLAQSSPTPSRQPLGAGAADADRWATGMPG